MNPATEQILAASRQLPEYERKILAAMLLAEMLGSMSQYDLAADIAVNATAQVKP